MVIVCGKLLLLANFIALGATQSFFGPSPLLNSSNSEVTIAPELNPAGIVSDPMVPEPVKAPLINMPTHQKQMFKVPEAQSLILGRHPAAGGTDVAIGFSAGTSNPGTGACISCAGKG
ncbi:unnamed protein product [Gongylonema pulchrum]|uniref:Secreted protein n=1 Tax=Gongylonema pulchrum TaxID=637853 RepID=A0A183DC01_9BILA|nr:unnamed protein product [Gongylonema pulchrum]